MSDPTDRLAELMQLIGFAAGHAIWCISEDEILMPLMLAERDQKRELTRFAAERIEDAVQQATESLRTNSGGWERAAVAYDGYLTQGDRRLDALIIQALEFGILDDPIRAHLGYHPGQIGEGFAIYRPVLIFPESVESDRQQLAQFFLAGLASHEQAAEVWRECYQDIPWA